jgi:ubiquinone/menaquinone biosynthesis C-methylase UbiE
VQLVTNTNLSPGAPDVRDTRRRGVSLRLTQLRVAAERGRQAVAIAVAAVIGMSETTHRARTRSFVREVIRGARTLGSVSPRDVLETAFTAALWWYAYSVLYPARALKRAGLTLRASPRGDELARRSPSGLGPFYSEHAPDIRLLASASENAHSVAEFERLAHVYEGCMLPFSLPIFEEALINLRPYIARDSRVLDAACGPGYQLRRVAELVPEGEVVGVDLAAEMVRVARDRAAAENLENCAFFQADIGALPGEFTGRFDLVYTCLAHHHFPDPLAAAEGALRCLRPGGIYGIVDPGPAWFNLPATAFARLADPGFVALRAPGEFREILRSAGFRRTQWVPLLPGYVLVVGQKEP